MASWPPKLSGHVLGSRDVPLGSILVHASMGRSMGHSAWPLACQNTENEAMNSHGMDA